MNSEPPKPICGNCHFTETTPQDIKTVRCIGAPPTSLPVSQSGMSGFAAVWPILGKDHPPCALYRCKVCFRDLASLNISVCISPHCPCKTSDAQRRN